MSVMWCSKIQVTQDFDELKTAMDIADKYQDRGAKRIIT